MSDEQHRGRRRPSREFHGGSSESSSAFRRPSKDYSNDRYERSSSSRRPSREYPGGADERSSSSRRPSREYAGGGDERSASSHRSSREYPVGADERSSSSRRPSREYPGGADERSSSSHRPSREYPGGHPSKDFPGGPDARYLSSRRPSREYPGGQNERPSTSRRPREDDIPEGEPVAKIKRERSTESGEQERKPAPKPDRQRRCRYDVVQTKPADITTKTGSTGNELKLVTNYYRVLKTPHWKIYQYHVDFEPSIEQRFVRGGILSEHKSILGGFLYDGMKLFSTNKLPEAQMVLRGTSRKGIEYTISMKFVGAIAVDEMQSLQILNIILRKSLEGLKLQLVGRNFYDSVSKIDLRQHRLQLWPGYQTSIRQHEQDILLCAEVAHKVMRTETLLDILMKCTETARDYKEEYRRSVLGLTVLTDYNNRTYRINDVDFESSPMDTFESNGKKISFIEYYQAKYRIRIRDARQPMLISTSKEKTFRRGSDKVPVENVVMLVPELCRATGLTDSMRSNFHLMRDMANFTRMNPDRRMERLRDFNRRLQSTPESIKVLDDWNLKLDRNLLEVKGRVINPERIVFGDNNKVSAGDQADWTKHFRNIKMVTSNVLDRWSIIVPQQNGGDMRRFIESLIRAAQGINMLIYRPREVFLNDDKNICYIQAMEDCAREDPKLIMLLVRNNNAEKYATIKKKGCLERAVPTQVITQRCVTNQRGLMSIATKVAIQINCKLGYTPWMIELPVKGLMTIGYDVAKSARDRSKSFGALVATMDLKQNATFYSTVAEGNAGDVLANNLWPMMTKALKQYHKAHDSLPSRVLFYRDGISEGSLKQVYEYEVKEIVQKLEEEYQRYKAADPPKFAYIIVTKAMNTRFFNRNINPPPGTIVDDVVTLPERYDFYLVSQSVRQGTVSPTSYNIVYSTFGLSPDQMQILTYKMTHLYYNWSGTTRVPAVCQYAKKLATLVATCLHKPPPNTLERKLYYL